MHLQKGHKLETFIQGIKHSLWNGWLQGVIFSFSWQSNSLMQIAHFSLFKTSGSFSCNSSSSIWSIFSWEVGVGLSLIILLAGNSCVDELYDVNVSVAKDSELWVVLEKLLCSSGHFEIHSLFFVLQLAFETQRTRDSILGLSRGNLGLTIMAPIHLTVFLLTFGLHYKNILNRN